MSLFENVISQVLCLVSTKHFPTFSLWLSQLFEWIWLSHGLGWHAPPPPPLPGTIDDHLNRPTISFLASMRWWASLAIIPFIFMLFLLTAPHLWLQEGTMGDWRLPKFHGSFFLGGDGCFCFFFQRHSSASCVLSTPLPSTILTKSSSVLLQSKIHV